MQNPKTYTSIEVAERVGVTDRTLRRWLRTGKVPAPARDRNNRPAFTQANLNAIIRYAFQLNPPTPRRERVRAPAVGVRA